MRTKNKSSKQSKPRTQPSRSQSLWDDDWLDDEDPTPAVPILRFSPTAWAKLLYFRDRSTNEVGGFGITRADDLLFVTQFVTIAQQVSSVSVKFDDEAVGRFFDEQVDLGRKPEQFARVWLHSHPGDCPEPSPTDETTFKRVFGTCQWAVMAIVAQDNSTYARLGFHTGPGGQILIPAEVDYSTDFAASDRDLWDAEYQANITAVDWHDRFAPNEPTAADAAVSCDESVPEDFVNELAKLDPLHRQLILDELAERPDLWDEEREVLFL
jgi:hypothetical protein